MDKNMDFLNLHGVKKKMNKYQKFYPKKILASIHEGYLGSLTENVSYISQLSSIIGAMLLQSLLCPKENKFTCCRGYKRCASYKRNNGKEDTAYFVPI